MDIVGSAIAAASVGSPIAIGSSAIAGALTSLGPCMAPRYVAMASIVGGSRGSAHLHLVAFVAGVVTGTAAIVLGSRTIVFAAATSSTAYECLAVVFIALALWMLAAPDHECEHRRQTLGTSWFLGATTTLFVSPCCTPVLLALGALAASSASPWFAVGAAVAYSAGHLAGLLVTAMVARRLSLRRGVHLRGAVQTVSAGLMLALGCYYAVLA